MCGSRHGYVVAGITTRSEAGIRKMKVRYEAIRGMATNPEDFYESEWYGEWEGGRIAALSTGGRLPVGLEGAIGIGAGETKLVVLEAKWSGPIVSRLMRPADRCDTGFRTPSSGHPARDRFRSGAA